MIFITRHDDYPEHYGTIYDCTIQLSQDRVEHLIAIIEHCGPQFLTNGERETRTDLLYYFEQLNA